MEYIKKHKLLFVGLLIHVSFYFSAIWIHWYDYFFFGSSIHQCCQGLDFYQIPNGAYAFLQGGDLTGKLPNGLVAFSKEIFTNVNVYHPLLTIILGGFFILFDYKLSFYLWIVIKLLLSLMLVYYFYKSFEKSKYVELASFILLISISQYNEIRISQFQFLFNASLLVLLINLVKNDDRSINGFFYFLTLIAKPIGILWAPVLILKKKFRTFLIGTLLFAGSTLVFLDKGNYFIQNIASHLSNPIPTSTIDIMSLDALLRYTLHLPTHIMTFIKSAFLIFVFALALIRKTNLLTLIYLLVVYFLLFYDLLYQYHFSVLAPILAVCLVTLPQFQTKIARFLILIISLPSVFFILRLLNIGIENNSFLGVNPTFFGWQIVSFFQILPIIILTILVLRKEISLNYASK